MSVNLLQNGFIITALVALTAKKGIVDMSKSLRLRTLLIFTVTTVLLSGCVERELTINTKPQGGLVIINDEEIGVSPVTVNFKWYGTYRVRIEKEGYNSLRKNIELKRPLHDLFPFDIFENLFNPNRVDSYSWNFKLDTYQKPDRKLLIDKAKLANEQMQLELMDAKYKVEQNKPQTKEEN